MTADEKRPTSSEKTAELLRSYDTIKYPNLTPTSFVEWTSHWVDAEHRERFVEAFREELVRILGAVDTNAGQRELAIDEIKRGERQP